MHRHLARNSLRGANEVSRKESCCHYQEIECLPAMNDPYATMFRDKNLAELESGMSWKPAERRRSWTMRSIFLIFLLWLVTSASFGGLLAIWGMQDGELSPHPPNSGKPGPNADPHFLQGEQGLAATIERRRGRLR